MQRRRGSTCTHDMSNQLTHLRDLVVIGNIFCVPGHPQQACPCCAGRAVSARPRGRGGVSAGRGAVGLERVGVWVVSQSWSVAGGVADQHRPDQKQMLCGPRHLCLGSAHCEYVRQTSGRGLGFAKEEEVAKEEECVLEWDWSVWVRVSVRSSSSSVLASA